MGENQYKIELGVHVKTSEIREQISKYNGNNNNAKLKLGIKLDTTDLKKQIKSLSLGGKGVAIPINTQSLEASLREVKEITESIKASLGTLDNKSGMQSLLSSVNQIATALGRATDESEGLVASLNALSKKDFSFNIGLDLGKKNNNNMIAYGRAARKQVIPELEAQIKELENLFGGQQAAMSRLTSQGSKVGFDVFTDFADFNSESAIKKMEAMEKYINSLKKLATIDNVNLDGFNEIHKDATELINDIAGIENAVDKAGDVPEKLKNLFGGSIDGESLSKQLDSIVADLGEIKTVIQGLSSGVSIEGLTQSFDRLSETIEKLVSNMALAKNALGDGLNANISDNGTEKAIQDQKELAQTFRETANEAKKLDGISIDISEGNVDDLRNALKNLKVDDSSIENATNELNEMNIVAKSVSGTLREGNLIKWEIKGIQTTTDGLERAVTITKTLGEEGWSSSAKYSQALDKVAIAAEKVKNRLSGSGTGTSKFDDEILQVETSYGKLTSTTKELDVALDGLRNSFKEVKAAANANDDEALLAANERYKESLRDVISLIKQKEVAERSANNDDALEVAKQNALLRLKNLFGENSEAARKFGSEINRIQKEINECGNLSGIPNLNRQITNLGLQVKEAGYQTETFGQKLKKQWQQYSTYLSVASLISYGTQALRDMFEQVKLIDSAMTELKKVTDESAESYNKFLTNAASRSKEIGTTIDGLVSSTADFARLGYGFEDAQGLAEVANIYAVVGDEIEGVEGATESLISTMAAFKDEMNGMSNTDFAMSIIDKFNEIGNNFAISSGGIGEALERSASSLMAANNTIDESIALITAANTVVVLCHAA